MGERMDEKQIYHIYAGILKLHKLFYGRKATGEDMTGFITSLNVLNSAHNSNFCNAMTDVLRRWFTRGFSGLEADEIAPFYTDLWRFHKKYLGQENSDRFWEDAVDETRRLNQKYTFPEFQKFTLAIMDELETRSVKEKVMEDERKISQAKVRGIAKGR